MAVSWTTFDEIHTATEDDLREVFLGRLSEDFNVFREVPGKHFSGKTLYLDAILTPKRPDEWKEPNVALGVEFKRLEKSYPLGYLTKATAQCVDYVSTDWDGFGFVHVFLCPGIFARWSRMNREIRGNADIFLHFLSDLGIGELTIDAYRGIHFLLHGDHSLWSQRNGVELGRRHNMTRKFGSR